MNLNLLTLFSQSTQQPSASGASQSSAAGQTNGTSGTSGLGDLMFGQLLAAKLQSQRGAARSGATDGLSMQDAQTVAQLKSQITTLLQNGVSLDQLASALAKALGANFLQQLQTQLGLAPGTDIQAALQKLLAQALAPPADGPPQTAGQQASAMVDRLIKVANAMGKVSENAAGQLKDSLGKVSDANAGDAPAPNPTSSILQSALAALQTLAVNASPSTATANGSTAPTTSRTVAGANNGQSFQDGTQLATTGTSTSGTSATTDASSSSNAALALSQATARVSDGRSVTSNPTLAMVGTGGETPIGRILARAANVAVTQASTQAADAAPGGTALLQPQIAIAAASSASNGNANDALMSSLLRSLQTALAAIPTQKDASTSADVATAGNSANPLSASSMFGSFVTTTVDPMGANPQTQTRVTVQTSYADPNGIVDQVLQGINLKNMADGSQTLQMRLVPESLGNVTVNLQVQGSTVNATLVAQTADARDVLIANQQVLMRSLSDAGMKLASFTVNLSNGGAQYQQSQNQPQQPQFGITRRFTGLNRGQADEPVAAVPTFGPGHSQLAAMQWLNALA